MATWWPQWPHQTFDSSRWRVCAGIDSQRWRAGLVKGGSTPVVDALGARSRGEKRRPWPRKWPIPGILASPHPQHKWPDPRAARESQAKKRARRSSEPL